MEEPERSLDKKKLKRFLIISGASYSLAQVGLYALWYKDQQSQSFQVFDDSQQWKQVDKAGHLYSAYHISQFGANAFLRAGLTDKKSYWYGALMGEVLLLPVEVFDGYSQAYGFSWSDLAANTAGALLLPIQYELWEEIRIQPKFSFHRTDFAPLRPNTLGNGLSEELLKDYNGQTYWFSVDIDKFFGTKNFPHWLNLAIGYGAENMVYSRSYENEAYGLKAYRQYYLAADFDLRKFRKPPTSVGNKLLNSLIYLSELIHLPAPALSYQEGKGFRFYPLYF